MSKAFTREENEGPEMADLPPVTSALPPGATNYMTAAGAERLRTEVSRLIDTDRPRLAEAARKDPEAKRRLALLDQRIFQIEQSLGSAQVVSHPPGLADRVTFGASVTVRGTDGNDAKYRIVGVDEIEMEENAVSWLSPIARALMNKKAGDRVRFESPAGPQELEIVAIAYE